MPYELREVEGGWKVCKKNSKKCFSKKPMSKAKAKRQMRALYTNTDESIDYNLLPEIIAEMIDEEIF